MLIDFEDVAAYLAPLCPVANNRKEIARRPHGEISDITGEADVGSTEVKKGMVKTGVGLRYYKKVNFDLFSHEQREEIKAWSAANRKQNRGKNQYNNNANNRNEQSDKQRQKPEAKVQRKMIASVVAAGLASNKAPPRETDVSAVEAAAITAAVTDAPKAQSNKKKPSAVSAIQVVDPKAGVPTADPAFKPKSVGQKLNWILNKAEK